MTDSEDRSTILKSKANIIVSAGAGSGKTTLLTNKIIKEADENRSHYRIAAITFTNKAANEIKEKLKGKSKGDFIGTNDNFVQNEIIVPFIKDAYGNEFSNDFSVEYSNSRFDSYDDGLSLLKNGRILGTYNNRKKNFKFELALNILKNSMVAKQYIKARYSRLYIDEYQDSDTDMNNLFMYIKELGVKLFIVGDIKQSIYSWRGADPTLFKEIFSDENNGFEKYQLTENFRCSIGIQNYANVIQYKSKNVYKENKGTIDVIGVKKEPLKQINMDDEVAVLVRRNSDAALLQQDSNSLGQDFMFIPRNPLDDLGTENKNILVELAKYTKNPLYTHYNFVSNLPGQFSKTEILKIKKIIEYLKSENLNQEKVDSVLIELFAYLGLVFHEEYGERDAFYRSVSDKTYENSFNGKEFKHKIMTIHSAKGLEFSQVIIYASDFRIYQNTGNEEHYVAATRAKEKLVVVMDDMFYLAYCKELCKSIGVEFDRIIKIV